MTMTSKWNPWASLRRLYNGMRDAGVALGEPSHSVRQYTAKAALVYSIVAVVTCVAAVRTAPAYAAAKVYVGNFKDNTVSVIDGASGKMITAVPVSAGPHGMAMTRD